MLVCGVAAMVMAVIAVMIATMKMVYGRVCKSRGLAMLVRRMKAALCEIVVV